MKRLLLTTILCFVFLSVNAFARLKTEHSSTNKNPFQQQQAQRKKDRKPSTFLPETYVLVPNRNDSTLSILATPSGKLLKKISSEDTGFEFEPMYASSLAKLKMIAVSDRLNSQLIFFDNRTFNFLGTVPTSDGLFHMWPGPEQNELFVVADIDRVVDAIKIKRFGSHVTARHRLIHAGIEAETGKPHDVVADKTHVYVTMLGVEGEDGDKEDLVLKYNRRTLQLEGRLTFSFDIHLGLPLQSPYLLVPETTAGKLNYVDKKTFEVVTDVKNLPGAHGIWWNNDASKIYLANFESQGLESIYEIRQSLDSDGFSAEHLSTHDLRDTKAHNITVDFVNQVMFVTHSGPGFDGQLNRNVSIFSVAGKPKFLKTVESGLNPLGILLVER